MTNIVSVNGVGLPSVTDYTVSSQDIFADSSGRTSNGTMHIDYIATKLKIALTWAFLNDEDRQAILNAIKSPEHLTFSVTFISLITGGPQTINCYKGDISIGAVMFRDGKMLWRDMTVNFIEI